MHSIAYILIIDLDQIEVRLSEEESKIKNEGSDSNGLNNESVFGMV
jgi:hypothetical protein